jgi:hypothetical protein
LEGQLEPGQHVTVAVQGDHLSFRIEAGQPVSA